MSEFYADTEDGPTSNFIGTFISSIDSGVLSLQFENDQPNEVLVRSRIIGIGTTAAGISTYRFQLPGQLDGTERTVKFESNFSNVSTSSTIASFTENQISSLKGFKEYQVVKCSSSVLVAHDSTDSNITLYHLSIGSIWWYFLVRKLVSLNLNSPDHYMVEQIIQYKLFWVFLHRY